MQKKYDFQIVTNDKVSPEKWDAYVQSHSRGSIFQHSAYLRCHISRYKSEAFGFAAVSGGSIVGVVAGVIIYNYFYPVSLFTRRAVIEGGPLTDDAVVAEALLEAVTHYTQKTAIYTQFRNMWEQSSLRPVYEKLGYRYEAHLDFLHDLSREQQEIISGISKNKRGNVHKALNKGCVFDQATEKEVDACIDLVHGTYKRIGLPCQTSEYFRFALEQMRGFAKVFVARQGDKVIGTRMELCFNGVVYDWFAGADDGFRNFYPNDFLPYHILLWSKENGYRMFDFGGAGRPDIPYGVREHKAKFGGQLVEYGRFERVNKKLMMHIGKIGLTMLKKK